MRALHHHHGHLDHGRLVGDPLAHHDARQHHTNRATPWFVLAAVAFLAALTVGCSSSDSSDSSGDDDADELEVQDADVSGTPAPITEAPPVDAANIFDTDFLGACDGVGHPMATAYDTTAGTISPVVVLAGEGTAMYGRSFVVRDAWTRQWTQENPLALAEVQLVVCAEKTSATPVQECTGYEVDGQVTDDVVILNEVTYEVSLREALTGAEVAATTVVANDGECPMYVTFTEGESSVEHDSFDDEAIQAFVEPYVLH